MTPCEKIGLKVGDKIRVLVDGRSIDRGEVARLTFDDGTMTPFFATKDRPNRCFSLNGDGDGGEGVSWERVVDEEHSLTKQLRSAITKRDRHHAKAMRQAEKLKQREAEVQRLIGELEREVEEATGLVCNISEPLLSGIPDGVDVDDPKT